MKPNRRQMRLKVRQAATAAEFAKRQLDAAAHAFAIAREANKRLAANLLAVLGEAMKGGAL